MCGGVTQCLASVQDNAWQHNITHTNPPNPCTVVLMRLPCPFSAKKQPPFFPPKQHKQGNTFYHNILGIIGSSSASYDVTRGVPHYDYALDSINKFTLVNSAANFGTTGGTRSDNTMAAAPDVSVRINESASKGINGAGFKGEEIDPSSGRLARGGGGNNSNSSSYDDAGDRQEVGSSRRN